MRSSILGGVFVIAAAALLGSCGGGGAASPGPVGGPTVIQPAAATLYAGVEYTFTIGGGRAPYFLASSEPALLPVPSTLNGNFFSVVPANPGVVDAGLPVDALPVKTVTITSRDTVGSTAATSGIQVAVNFMTGYGVTYRSNCSAAGGGAVAAAAPSACAGGETLVTMVATINGNRLGNRAYKFEVLRGPFYWVFPNSQGQGGAIAGNVLQTNTDHEGKITAIFQVNQNVGTQLGVFRVTDVATGASTTQVFTITGVPVTGALTILPNEFTFTGRDTATCGTGTADFLVFDGTPPYSAVSSTPDLTVTALDSTGTAVSPAVSNSQPGRFRLSATNPFVCLADAAIVVTSANNSRATVTVTTEAGSADPPPNPISVVPGALALDCGQAGSFTIVGGSLSGGTFTISMPGIVDSRVVASITDRTVTITRVATDSPVPPLAPRVDQNFTFTVTDSSNNTNTTTIGIQAPTACPHS
jgi:hypothetical protein